MFTSDNGWGHPKRNVWEDPRDLCQHIKAYVGSINFIGTYDPAKHYDYGDVCIRDGNTFIFDGRNSWTELATISDIHATTSTPMKYSSNCKNCGAPMRNHKCDYCGTEDYGK